MGTAGWIPQCRWFSCFTILVGTFGPHNVNINRNTHTHTHFQSHHLLSSHTLRERWLHLFSQVNRQSLAIPDFVSPHGRYALLERALKWNFLQTKNDFIKSIKIPRWMKRTLNKAESPWCRKQIWYVRQEVDYRQRLRRLSYNKSAFLHLILYTVILFVTKTL